MQKCRSLCLNSRDFRIISKQPKGFLLPEIYCIGSDKNVIYLCIFNSTAFLISHLAAVLANTYTKKSQTRREKIHIPLLHAHPLGLVSRAMTVHTDGSFQRLASPIFTGTGNDLHMVSRQWEVTGSISISMLQLIPYFQLPVLYYPRQG